MVDRNKTRRLIFILFKFQFAQQRYNLEIDQIFDDDEVSFLFPVPYSLFANTK